MSIKEKAISITVGNSAMAKAWYRRDTTVGEFFDSLKRDSDTRIIPKTLPEFKKLGETKEGKEEQKQLKDAPGFVGATFSGTARTKAAVTSRTMVTLDIDNEDAETVNTVDNVVERVKSLGCAFCIYSTAKHCKEKPRLRVIIPLETPCGVDEHDAIARKIAEKIGLDSCDCTTFDANRLMYVPTSCKDADKVFLCDTDSPALDGNKVLDEYSDWKDMSLRPGVDAKHAQMAMDRLGKEKDNPFEKPRYIGAFNRVYTVSEALTHPDFIPGIYEEVKEGRWTYTGGSSQGGVLINDETGWFTSMHNTDAANGSHCAYDVVRIHKFGHLDKDVKPGTKFKDYPSQKEMEKFCAYRPEVVEEFKRANKEKAAQKVVANLGVEGEEERKKIAAIAHDLKTNSEGKILNITQNIVNILRTDDNVKVGKKFVYDEFSRKRIVLEALPCSGGVLGEWSDVHDAAVRTYIENRYEIGSKDKVADALIQVSRECSIDVVKDYFENLPEWDGVERLDTLFIDMLDAEDSPAIREVTRKLFVAAVTRTYEPGKKWDCMPILYGSQGCGKSSILELMCPNKDWFNKLHSMEGNKAIEETLGMLVMECEELKAFTKSSSETAKAYISNTVDRARLAYARNAESYPRRFIIVGTTNEETFLQDTTGNRRYPVIRCNGKRGVTDKRVWAEIPKIRDMVWAEAKFLYDEMYSKGIDSLNFTTETVIELEKITEAHTESAMEEGLIEEFIQRKVPKGWYEYALDERRDYWKNYKSGLVDKNIQLVERDRFCPLEIWRELFGHDETDMPKGGQANRIVNCIRKVLPEGWEYLAKFRRNTSVDCVKQRIFVNTAIYPSKDFEEK